jgi:hypothetical protein
MRNAQRKSVDSQKKKTGYLKENSASEINSKKDSIRKLYSGMNGFEEGREYKMYSVKKYIYNDDQLKFIGPCIILIVE